MNNSVLRPQNGLVKGARGFTFCDRVHGHFWALCSGLPRVPLLDASTGKLQDTI